MAWWTCAKARPGSWLCWTSRSRSRGGGSSSPEDLEERTETLIPDEVRADRDSFRQVGEEVTELPDIIPLRFVKTRLVHPRFVRKEDRQAPPFALRCRPGCSREGYRGLLQCDGYGVYRSHSSKKGFLLIGCMAHVRRKFHEAFEDAAEDAAAWYLLQFKALYANERECMESGSDRRAYRIRKSAPLMAELKQRLDRDLQSPPPKSAATLALRRPAYPAQVLLQPGGDPTATAKILEDTSSSAVRGYTGRLPNRRSRPSQNTKRARCSSPCPLKRL